MEQKSFETTFDSICQLNNSEGPSRNIFEPKFAAREQMLGLKTAIENCIKEAPSLAAQAQLTRCYVFIGNNMIETDEEKDGFQMLLKAHSVISQTLRCQILTSTDVKEDELTHVLLENSHPLQSAASSESPTDVMEFAFEYLETLNAVCVFLANDNDTRYRLDDARKLLHRAEDAYEAWKSWFRAIPVEDRSELQDLKIDDDGKLSQPDSSSSARRRNDRLLHRVEGCHTTTIFLLGQVYGQKGDQALASKYCHWTLSRQLLTRQEFSRKEWAKNAIMLATFYDSIRDFGKARYCLRAGELMMPKDKADEETTGVVCWGFARHHANRLAYYAAVANDQEELASAPSRADEWWVDFNLELESPTPLPHITSFEGAREEFKEGNKWFQEALKYYVIDGCCTDHIRILQDIGTLYKHLIVFEPDVERRIAMHSRRVALIEKLPSELHFQSYAVLIRQLLFDSGDIYTDILDLRILQKKSPDNKYGKPLSDAKMNALCAQAKSFFEKFCDTFKDTKTGQLPTVIEEESRVAFFRCLMRIAHLQSKIWYKTPQEEYEGIGKTIECYKSALEFANKNTMAAEVAAEVRLAREMIELLPAKQREIRMAFASKST